VSRALTPVDRAVFPDAMMICATLVNSGTRRANLAQPRAGGLRGGHFAACRIDIEVMPLMSIASPRATVGDCASNQTRKLRNLPVTVMTCA